MKIIEEMIIDYMNSLPPGLRSQFYKECDHYCETGETARLTDFSRSLPGPPPAQVRKWGAYFFTEYKKNPEYK